MVSSSVSLSLTPHGRLTLQQDADAAALIEDHLQKAFELGSGHGLLFLGIEQSGASLPPVISYWRDFAVRYVTAVCGRANPNAVIAPISDEDLERLVLAAPPMTGGEYLTTEVLISLWKELTRRSRLNWPKQNAMCRSSSNGAIRRGT